MDSQVLFCASLLKDSVPHLVDVTGVSGSYMERLAL